MSDAESGDQGAIVQQDSPQSELGSSRYMCMSQTCRLCKCNVVGKSANDVSCQHLVSRHLLSLSSRCRILASEALHSFLQPLDDRCIMTAKQQVLLVENSTMRRE